MRPSVRLSVPSAYRDSTGVSVRRGQRTFRLDNNEDRLIVCRSSHLLSHTVDSIDAEQYLCVDCASRG